MAPGGTGYGRTLRHIVAFEEEDLEAVVEFGGLDLGRR